MAVDMYLKLDGIEGEAADSSHKKEIDILSCSWGLSQQGSSSMGGGGGSGKVSFSDIHITKKLDSSTPHLSFRCCNGDPIKKAEIVFRKAGKDQQEYLKIILTDVLISNISSGASGGDDTVMENLTLNFATFKLEYKPQKADGSLDAVIPIGWDLKKNAKF
jgi:type VI secretion system secreted protein Hcp